jgi:hypothetical protein
MPVLLARMVTSDPDGNIVYRASKGKCLPFPVTGDDGGMKKGIPRNFHIYEPLEFLAQVAQHIPNKGEHQVKYYGFYSNKKRGMLGKQQKGKAGGAPSWIARSRNAMQQKMAYDMGSPDKACPERAEGCVYEVDPLKCPNCGSTMKIVSFIDQEEVIEQILRHCGKWN